jgi:hypothetical protein
MYIKSFVLIMIFCGFTTQAFANEQQESKKPKEIKSLRFSQSPDYSRLVFDTNDAIDFKVFTLKDPHRLVIDIADINRRPKLTNMDLKNSSIENIRTAIRNSSDLRIVLDLKSAVNSKHFILNADNNQDNRLVIDLYKLDKNIDQLTQEAKNVQEKSGSENPFEQKTVLEILKADQITESLNTKIEPYKEKLDKNNVFFSYSFGAINNDHCNSSFAGEISAGVKINSKFSTQLSHVMADCYHTENNRNPSDKRLTLNELTFRYSPLNSSKFFEYGLATYSSDDSSRSNTPVLGVGMPYVINHWQGEIKLKIYPGDDETITYMGISFGFN